MLTGLVKIHIDENGDDEDDEVYSDDNGIHYNDDGEGDVADGFRSSEDSSKAASAANDAALDGAADSR